MDYGPYGSQKFRRLGYDFIFPRVNDLTAIQESRPVIIVVFWEEKRRNPNHLMVFWNSVLLVWLAVVVRAQNPACSVCGEGQEISPEAAGAIFSFPGQVRFCRWHMHFDLLACPSFSNHSFNSHRLRAAHFRMLDKAVKSSQSNAHSFPT